MPRAEERKEGGHTTEIENPSAAQASRPQFSLPDVTTESYDEDPEVRYLAPILRRL